MSIKISGVLAVCAIAMIAGCSAVIVAPRSPATIRVENDLTAMTVDVGGTTTDVNGIDLENVMVGDVSFSSVNYGSVTQPKGTGRSGQVTVNIGTAVVWTVVLDQVVPVYFTNVASMTTTITPETENTVVFDQATAGVIFSALAKKQAQQR